MIYLLLPLGLLFLIKGADLLVDGASSIAKKLGVSALMIGLTVVAFGTSVPELIINVLASVRGNTDMAIGNILGSNIANILLILGISAMIFPITVKRQTTWKEIPFGLLAIIVVAFMASDTLIDGGIFSGLTRIDGLVLLSFFIIFLYYVFSISLEEPSKDEELNIHHYSFTRAFFMIIIGLGGVNSRR